MIAARFPPAESPPTMIGTSAPAMSVDPLGDPLEGGVGVVDGDRVAVLGRQAVVHEHDRAPRRGGQLAPEGVELVDVAADHPTAAVVVDEDPSRRALRHEHAGGDRLAIPDRDAVVFDARHLRTGAVELGEPGRQPPDLLGRALVDRLDPGRRHLREKGGECIVQRHDSPSVHVRTSAARPTPPMIPRPSTYSGCPIIRVPEQVPPPPGRGLSPAACRSACGRRCAGRTGHHPIAGWSPGASRRRRRR